MGQRFQYVIKLKDKVEIDKNYDGQSKVESDKIALHHHWGGHVYSTQRLVQINNHIQENDLKASDLKLDDVKTLLFRNELTNEDTPMSMLSQKDLDKPLNFDNNDGIVVIDLSKDEMSYTFVDLENRTLLDAEGYLELYRSYPIDTENPGLFNEQETALEDLEVLTYEDLKEVYPELHTQIENEKEMEKYIPVFERFQEMKDNQEINYYNDLEYKDGKFDTVFNYPVDIQQMYSETKEREVFDKYMDLHNEKVQRMESMTSITGMPINVNGFYDKYDEISEYQLTTDISIEKEAGEGYKILTREGKDIYQDEFFQNRFNKMENELNEFYQPKIQELNDMKMEIDKSLADKELSKQEELVWLSKEELMKKYEESHLKNANTTHIYTGEGRNFDKWIEFDTLEEYKDYTKSLNGEIEMTNPENVASDKAFYRVTDTEIGEFFDIEENDLWNLANDVFEDEEEVEELFSIEEVIESVKSQNYKVELIDPKNEKELLNMDAAELEKMLIDDNKEKEESLLNHKMFVRETKDESIILGTYRMNEMKADSDEMRIFKECFPAADKSDFNDYVIRRTQEFDEDLNKSYGESQLIIRKEDVSKEELKMTIKFNAKLNEHYSNLEEKLTQNKELFEENVKSLNNDKEQFVKTNHTEMVEIKEKNEVTKEKGMDLSL